MNHPALPSSLFARNALWLWCATMSRNQQRAFDFIVSAVMVISVAFIAAAVVFVH
jgi:hypothetical protein